MTTAPSHPLQHAYLGDRDPMEMVDTRIGPMQRWRSDALLLGEVSGLSALRDTIKNDAVRTLDEIETRERNVAERETRCDARDRAFKDAVAKFMDRAAPFVDRVEQARADQEREQEPVAKPPGAASDSELEPELHSIRGKENPEPTELETDAASLGDPSSPRQIEQDVRGEFLRRKDQAEFPDPELARPPVVQQPIAAGLDQMTE